MIPRHGVAHIRHALNDLSEVVAEYRAELAVTIGEDSTTALETAAFNTATAIARATCAEHRRICCPFCTPEKQP